MTSPALLLLAACALAASLHAATIPESAHLQKKIPAALPDDNKDPSPANHEIIAPELIKEAGNDLRAKPEDIPVEVVVDDAEPLVKINEVGDEETNRPAVDLRNPGPPQRQEHETQNPERHSDEELKVSTIKENIEQAQNLLRQSFQDVSDNIQTWFYKTDDQNKIHKNIQNLRDTFTSQIQKLNSTIQTLVKPEASEPVATQQEESQSNYEKVQSRLKVLENTFNNDVDTLSAGVELYDSLRSSAGEEDAFKEEAPAQTGAGPSTTAPQIIYPILQAFTNIRDQMIGGLQNLWPGSSTGTQPGASTVAQADTPGQTPEAPGSSWFQWPNQGNNPLAFFQNIFNQNQSAFNPGAFNPLNLFPRPSASEKPADTATNAAPVKPADKPAEAAVDKPADAVEKPAAAPAPAPAPQPAAAQPAAAQPSATQPDAGGPIRQFLNSIPVVQRIQNTITNRDTPRDPIKKNDGQSKGGWYGPPRKPAGSGDNNDSGVSEQKLKEVKEGIKEEPVKEESIKEGPVKAESVKEEPIKEESIKEEYVKEESIKEESIKEESIKKIETEVKPEVVPAKTE